MMTSSRSEGSQISLGTAKAVLGVRAPPGAVSVLLCLRSSCRRKRSEARIKNTRASLLQHEMRILLLRRLEALPFTPRKESQLSPEQRGQRSNAPSPTSPGREELHSWEARQVMTDTEPIPRHTVGVEQFRTTWQSSWKIFARSSTIRTLKSPASR